ncbi:uncharacterized protein CPUR_08827 [Claviceps purpurea 20.1]|uniref:PiggyBac transposable element-derived protein domain-containing protein n=1 Tax=Claviceps purpurea (strain 20.1) TaxID=1111077 RepID=M1WGV9_CLAP2|nr:uncharacterized protein CPUR_08827 [Claviceps purpurea 20.1]
MADSPVQPAPKLSQRKLAATQRGHDFQPLRPADREASISQLPDDPVDLFHRFCPESLVEKWVVWTNSWAKHRIEQRANAADSGKPDDEEELDDEEEDTSAPKWVPTTVAEIYIFLAVLIYMGNHPEQRIQDHWIEDKEPGAGDPTHRIMKYMTYPRFTQLFRYIRIFDPFDEPADNLSRLLSRVTPWSEHIQQAATDLFQPGLNVAVDECMIRFTGRSNAKVTIPRKPTPEGLKIWVVADHGYFLRWIFHLPGQKPEIKFPQEPHEPELAPTQAVVLDLVRRLETNNHHVFFDNLFTTVELLRALRRDGNAATGTARTGSGIWEEHRESKLRDNTGKLDWQYNTLKAIPTSDNLVNQIAWKDNALVLFMTTYFTGLEFEDIDTAIEFAAVHGKL